MRRRALSAAAILMLVSSVTAASPAPAGTHDATGAHRLVVVVKKTLTPAAERKLALLILISQSGSAPSAAVATAGRPLTVILDNRGLYRVKAEVDAACHGTCSGSYRISGAADHKLQVVPSCRPKGAGFVCSRIRIVKLA